MNQVNPTKVEEGEVKIMKQRKGKQKVRKKKKI